MSRPGELSLLFAGPPCQGFSIIGSRVVWDERNNLFLEVLRTARDLRPQCVAIENVPGLVTLAGGAYLRSILQGLSDCGYAGACAELLAAQHSTARRRCGGGWSSSRGVRTWASRRGTASRLPPTAARSATCCRTAPSPRRSPPASSPPTTPSPTCPRSRLARRRDVTSGRRRPPTSTRCAPV
ncbi:DNA cytosine methyltransferase [Candidatus Protofrankia californiensis]|uniref:DNA cytosine methyltransferase n=1 Tax=Candidatus Protofrankia californiensis TaxID=1839754 RepID=UPI003D33A9F8